MTIDIFQYSNMYTLRRSIQWLADEAHVREECGLYVTKPGVQYFVVVCTVDWKFRREGNSRLAEIAALVFSSKAWKDCFRMDGGFRGP
jgi:hypothetical protein